MIAKLPKKDIIALVYITLLTVVALWYGFTAIPSPILQRDLSFDEARMNSINAIQSAIALNYTQNNAMPQRLDDLTKNSAISSEDLSDPQTKEQYEYAITSETEYKICATFATDSSQQKTTDRYQYYSTTDKKDHPKGYYCFTNTVIQKNILPPIWNPKDGTYIPLGSDSAEQSDSQDNAATPSAGSNGVG